MKSRLNYVLSIIVKRWIVVVLIAMLATFALSLYMGLGQSIWFDEGYSILLAQRPLPELIALTNVDAHPPLYYIVLKGWASVFGWSELALRSLSALLAAGAVGAAALFVRSLFTARIALVVLPFLVLAPFWIRYGYEVRMYALAGLIVLLASYVLTRALRKDAGRGWWIAYAVLVAAGMYTLYMTLVIWLAHLVWLVVTAPSKKTLHKQPFALAFVGSVVLFLPQLPIFLHQTQNSALPGIGSELTLNKLISTLGMLTVYTPGWQIGGWLSLILIAALVLFGFTWSVVTRVGKYKKELLLVTCLVLVPLAFYAVTSLPPRIPIFIERYMAHISLFVALLVGVSVALAWAAKRRRVSVVFGALSLSLSVFGLYRLHDVGNLNLERMQLPMTAEMRQAVPCSKDTVVVADDPYTYIDSAFYFADCNLVFYSPKEIGFSGGYAPLHSSASRLASPDVLTARTIVHLHWDGGNATFAPPATYQQMNVQTFDKQVVTIYEQR